MNTRKLLALASILVMWLPLAAQDELFIYGKVTTVDDKVYEGPIRWGKEEVYWVDLFNAGKESNDNLKYLSRQEKEELDDRQYRWLGWSRETSGNNWKRWFGNWGEYEGSGEYTHQFACQFGEIKSITASGRNDVTLEMKNGSSVSLEGEGYNDVGASVRVVDPELGEVQLDWGRIRKVEFMKTPAALPNKFGQPLYATVEAYGEKFSGYIQWDHDERLGTDKLDGETDDGDVSIEFSKIRSIEKRGRGCVVMLKSGRELRMDDSNDVDSGNRGIIIMNSDLLEVDVPWAEFQKITFDDKPQSSLSTYDTFGAQAELKASVETTEGAKHSGKVIFDLDEEYNYELLQGKRGDVEFTVAFKNVKRLQPLGEHRCELELRSGQKFVLDDAQDVNERNQGLLVFEKAGTAKYVRWDKLKSIEFK